MNILLRLTLGKPPNLLFHFNFSWLFDIVSRLRFTSLNQRSAVATTISRAAQRRLKNQPHGFLRTQPQLQPRSLSHSKPQSECDCGYLFCNLCGCLRLLLRVAVAAFIGFSKPRGLWWLRLPTPGLNELTIRVVRLAELSLVVYAIKRIPDFVYPT